MAVPSRPTKLRAVQNGSSAQVDLSWVDNASDETAYKIERKTNRGSWVEIKGDAAANSTSYNDTTVTLGSYYEYRVRCSNAEGNSSYSNEIDIIPTKVGSFNHVKDRLQALIALSTAALTPQATHVYGDININPVSEAKNMPIAAVSVDPMRYMELVYGRRTPANVAGKMFEIDFVIYIYAKRTKGSEETATMAQAIATLVMDYLDAQALGQSAYKIHNIYDLRMRESESGASMLERMIIEGTALTSRADA